MTTVMPSRSSAPWRAFAAICAHSSIAPSMRVAQRRVGEEVDLLLGKIDRRFDVHARLGDGFGQRMHGDGELALQRAQRGARRLDRAAVDQIGDRFGLRQVELVVEKCAAA